MDAIILHDFKSSKGVRWMDENNDINQDSVPETPEFDDEGKNWMTWLPALVIAGLVLGAAGVYIFQRSRISPQPATTEAPTQAIEETGNENSGLMIGNNAIVVGNVAQGDSVIIDSVTLAQAGYVVIHEDEEGTPGDVIGKSQLLPEGTMQDVLVELERDTTRGETLYAMLHKDDGNREFDFPEDDGPIINENQDPIMMIFTVGEEPATDGDGEVSL